MSSDIEIGKKKAKWYEAVDKIKDTMLIIMVVALLAINGYQQYTYYTNRRIDNCIRKLQADYLLGFGFALKVPVGVERDKLFNDLLVAHDKYENANEICK